MANSQLSVGVAPHICLTVTTSRRMLITAVCLSLPVILSSLYDGFSSLFIALAALTAALAAELMVNLHQNRLPITDGSSLVTALVLTLLLPNTINPFMAAAGAVFAVLIAKWSFGGLGANWFNPAAVAWLFIHQCWPAAFSQAMEASALSRLSEAVARGTSDPSGSPATILRIIGQKASGLDATVTKWLNDTLFIPLRAELPDSYFDLVFPLRPALIGDRGFLALLPATIILIALSIVPFYIPLAFLLSYTIALRIWGALPFGGSLFNGDMLFGLSSAAVLIGAFILSSDPAVSAKTKSGKILLAAMAGLLSFFFRYICGEPFGLVAAILLINLLTPLLRQLETVILCDKRRKI